jgi:hypothetical protein
MVLKPSAFVCVIVFPVFAVPVTLLEDEDIFDFAVARSDFAVGVPVAACTSLPKSWLSFVPSKVSPSLRFS